jgi:hypothetical protein
MVEIIGHQHEQNAFLVQKHIRVYHKIIYKLTQRYLLSKLAFKL